MFFLMLGVNLAFLVSGIMALFSAEVVGGTALLTASVAGFGVMIWYYQGVAILASDSANIHSYAHKRKKKRKSKLDWCDCDLPDCDCAPDCDCSCD